VALVDDTGQKITDMGAIRFAAPVVSETQQIIAKIGELIDRIGGAIEGFGALASAAGSVPSVPSVPAASSGSFQTGGLLGGSSERSIRAHGGEFVMSRSAVARIGADTLGAMNRGGAGGGGPVINIDLSGSVISDDQARDRLARDVSDRVVERLGIRRRFNVGTA
jgi:lambda family phage tail tape measure protein